MICFQYPILPFAKPLSTRVLALYSKLPTASLRLMLRSCCATGLSDLDAGRRKSKTRSSSSRKAGEEEVLELERDPQMSGKGQPESLWQSVKDSVSDWWRQRR